MQPPATPWQLWRLPLLGVVLGGGLGLSGAPLFGGGVALVLAAAAAAALAVPLAQLAWRGVFGPRSWLLGAALMAVLLLAAVWLVGSAVALVAGEPALGRRVAAAGSALLLLAVAGGALLERRRLADRHGSWWVAVVDARRGRVGAPLDPGPAPGGAQRLGVLAAAAGVNVPLALELAGYRAGQWFPWVAAAMGVAVLYLGWQWLGPLLARAQAVLALEAETGTRFRHRDLESVQALRRGGAASPAHGNAATRGLRALRATLQAVAGIGFVGGATVALAFAWPDWQQARDWAGFRRAAVVVTAVDVTAQRGEWVGQGTVEDRPVDFRPRELDAVLGRPPVTRQEALAKVQPRLPLRAEAWWNPALAQRLLPPQASEAAVREQARFSAGFAVALLAAGAAALLLDRGLRRRQSGGAR